MIRKTLFAISMLSTGVILAAPITPDEALARLANGSPATRAAASPLLVKTMETTQGSPAIYVFNNNQGEGFMVLSADDAFTPLLGYSDTGRYDASNPELAYWLSEYSRQIEFATQSGEALSTRSGITLPEWSAIAPLTKTQWNQDAPYNDKCPEDPNYDMERSFTGCVATSMAQVMKYFEYPEVGQGSNSYNCETLGYKLSMVFSDTPFDWANMLDSYAGSYTEEQAEAVAYLMRACGISVNMLYTAGPAGSFTFSNMVTNAVTRYFKYDKGIRYYTRSNYTYTDWASMLYNNLKDVGPIIYNGTGLGGGHSFVFDGYDGNGYFHINWGWGGLSDGYYLLDTLEPAGLGIGAGTGAYNFDQGAVFNMKPAGEVEGEQQRDVVMYGSLQGVINGNTLTLKVIDALLPGWGIQALTNMNLLFGLAYVPAETPDAAPQYISEINTNYYTITPFLYLDTSTNVSFDMSKFKMEDGVKYKMSCVYHQKNSDIWKPVISEVGKYDWFYLTKNGNTFTVENMTPMQFSASSLQFLSGLYYDGEVKVAANLINSNDTELTRTVAVVLLDADGKIQFVGPDNLFSLAADSTDDVEFTTLLFSLEGVEEVMTPTEFYPGLYNSEAGVVIYSSTEPVTMYPALESGVESLYGISDEITFVYDNTGNITANGAEIEVYTLSGVKVLTGKDSLSTSKLAKGVYVAVINSGKGSSKAYKIVR